MFESISAKSRIPAIAQNITKLLACNAGKSLSNKKGFIIKHAVSSCCNCLSMHYQPFLTLHELNTIVWVQNYPQCQNACSMQPKGNGNTCIRWRNTTTRDPIKKNFLMPFKTTSCANQRMSIKYPLHHFLWLLHIKATWPTDSKLQVSERTRQEQGGWHVAHSNWLLAHHKYRDNTTVKSQRKDCLYSFCCW